MNSVFYIPQNSVISCYDFEHLSFFSIAILKSLIVRGLGANPTFKKLKEVG